jgi:hypothetical protein
LKGQDDGRSFRFLKTFPLDANILAPGSSANISIDGSTDANALSAILNNNRFPDGDIELGHIKLAADTGKRRLLQDGQ